MSRRGQLQWSWAVVSMSRRGRATVQIHLACVATLKGDEDEAVELLSCGQRIRCHALAVRHPLPCFRAEADREAWVDDEGTATESTRGWRGMARLTTAMASRTKPSALLRQWRLVSKGKATVESAGLRGEMAKFLTAAVAAAPGGSAMPSFPPPAGGNEGAA